MLRPPACSYAPLMRLSLLQEANIDEDRAVQELTRQELAKRPSTYLKCLENVAKVSHGHESTCDRLVRCLLSPEGLTLLLCEQMDKVYTRPDYLVFKPALLSAVMIRQVMPRRCGMTVRLVWQLTITRFLSQPEWRDFSLALGSSAINKDLHDTEARLFKDRYLRLLFRGSKRTKK